MKIQLKEITGLRFAADSVRLSFNSESKRKEQIGIQHYQLWDDDVALLSGLIAKGDSHAKVMRFVDVYAIITAPRYFWQEFSTYRYGVEMMSRSTVHTLLKDPITLEMFERGSNTAGHVFVQYIEALETLRQSKDLVSLKKLLPESFLQERAVKMNYQALRHIYHDRKNHKLPEWHTFIDAMTLLPFFEEFIKVPAKAT